MKQTIGCLTITVVLMSCNTPPAEKAQADNDFPIRGTWKLISGTLIEKTDTVVTDYTKGQKMIKIINDTHFSFLRHDLNKGKDTAIYSSGGGSYTLKGDQYTENLEYCDDRQWEGNSFKLTVNISNDTLTQTGIEKIDSLGINRFNIEKYVRVKE